MIEELIARAGEIVAKKTGGGNEGHCVLALIDKDGYPTASTISVSKADGIDWLTFCTGLSSNKIDRIRKCSHASVCFDAIDHNITLVGTIEILTGSDIKKEMWYKGLEDNFGGPEDPNYCVLSFKTERYNLLVDWKEASGTI